MLFQGVAAGPEQPLVITVKPGSTGLAVMNGLQLVRTIGPVFDLQAGWSDTSNPSGPWAFRAGETVLPHVDDWFLDSYGYPQPGWAFGSTIPFWFRSAGVPNPGEDWQPGDIVAHTGDRFNGTGHGEANVTWASSFTGSVSISGAVWERETLPTSEAACAPTDGISIWATSCFPQASLEVAILIAETIPWGCTPVGAVALCCRTFGSRQAMSCVSEFVPTGLEGDYAGVKLSILTTPLSPLLTSQPQSQSVAQGGAATFSVVAAGAPPLVYQWLHNGAPVAGGTGPTLELASVQPSDAGAYSVRVSNASGSVTSDPALLSVLGKSGLMARWSFDESGGMIAHDQLGNFDGRLSATGAEFVPGGRAGNALRLDRTANGYVDFGNVLGLTDTAFSIVAWIKTAPGDQSANSLVLAKHESGFNNGYFVDVNHSNSILGQDDKAMFFAGDAYSVPVSATSVNDGNWHQLAAVHELAGDNLIYVDGGPAEAAVRGLPVVPSSAPLLIGGASFNGMPVGMFSGLIDDVQIFDRALTPDEVNVLFQNPTGQTNSVVSVTTLAGSGEPGFKDGPATSASFNAPNGGTVSLGKAAYIADTRNHVIRRVELATGEVRTLAGTGVAGDADGPAASAQFNSPLGVFEDVKGGALFVADTGNNRIRKISADDPPHVGSYAGSGIRGYLDGPAAAAQFDFPNDLVIDSKGIFYIVEFNNHTVRKLDLASGNVSTFVGNGAPGFADGVGTRAGLNQPAGIAVDQANNLYVTEWGSHRIRKVTPPGR